MKNKIGIIVLLVCLLGACSQERAHKDEQSAREKRMEEEKARVSEVDKNAKEAAIREQEAKKQAVKEDAKNAASESGATK